MWNPRANLISTRRAAKLVGGTPQLIRTWKYRGKLVSRGKDPWTGGHLWLEYDVLMIEASTRRTRRTRGGHPRGDGLLTPAPCDDHVMRV